MPETEKSIKEILEEMKGSTSELTTDRLSENDFLSEINAAIEEGLNNLAKKVSAYQKGHTKT